MSKIAIFGDIHLTKRTWTKRQEIMDDAASSLRQITDICIKNKYHAVFLGDQFDTNYPPVEMVQIWYECVDLFQKHKLNVYTIDGNHDPGQQETDVQIQRSWTKVHPHVQHLDMTTVTVEGVKIAGYDFRPASNVHKIVEDIQATKADIYCMHQFPRQYKFYDLENAWDIDLDGMEDKIFFCGHIHDNCEVDFAGKGKLYIVGSTNPRSLAETTKKHYYTIDSNKNIQKHDLFSRPIYRISFINPESYDESFTLLSKACSYTMPKDDNLKLVAKPVLGITYNFEDKELPTKIASIVGDKAHIFYTPKFRNVQLTVRTQEDNISVTLKDAIAGTIMESTMKNVMYRIIEDPDNIESTLISFERTLTTEEPINDEEITFT